MIEEEFISCRDSKVWKPLFKLGDCSADYLKLCSVDYRLLRNPFSTKHEEIDSDEEQKLWKCLGVFRPCTDEAFDDQEKETENPFYTTSVPSLHSKREMKRLRRAARQSKLEKWYDMPKPQLTQEERNDLEVIRLRRALTTDTHVKRSDTKFKYFQQGVVVDDPGSFYERVPRKQRGRTLVDELLANAELMQKQRKRFARIKRAEAERKAAMRRQKMQRLKRLKNKSGKKQSTIMVPQ